MKFPRSIGVIFASLLVWLLMLLVGHHWSSEKYAPSDEKKRISTSRVSDSISQESPAVSDTSPPSAIPQDSLLQKVAQEQVVAGQAAPKDWIKQVIAEEWTDGPDKLAGRQRVRIVVADFKYPHLRIEESVSTDPATGLETIKFLRASVADHLMLGLKPGVDFQHAAEALREKGYPVRSIEQGSFILAELAEFAEAGDQAKAVADLALLEEFIDFAEPDYLVFPTTVPNDPAYSQGKLWGLHNPGSTADSKADADIDAPEAWAIRNDASSIVVAVTDTGIKHDHEDLIENRWTHPTTPGVHGYDAYDNDNDPMDVGGHGTHCAGTIGARGDNAKGLTGVAWKVKLMGVRFLGPNGGSTSDAIKVVNYSRLNGAHLISASWGGGGYSQGLYNAINACAEAGIPFVAAAGNSSTNNDATPHYPSSYNSHNIISVASTTQADKLSTFSCYGRTSVDIAAPGSGIWSTYTGSGNNYTFLNGTSMATPHVSGALALAMAEFPDDDMSAIIARLYASVDKIPALSGKVSTGGRLNVAKLLGNEAPEVSNDSFANALRFDDFYGTWTGTNVGATRESGEDTFSMPNTGNKSLWFAFRTPHSGLVTLDLISTVLNYSAVVYEGSVKGELKPLKISGVFDGYVRQVIFTSKPNTEYRIVLDSYYDPSQLFRITYNITPPNDFFIDATPLSGELFSVPGSNRAATSEPFEQTKRHAGTGQGKSVWWKWTAPADMDFTINTVGSAFDTVLAIYTGETTESLTEVATSDDRNALDWTSQVTFAAVAGTTYHIAVDSFREDAAGDIKLNGFRSGTLNIIRQPSNLSVQIGKRAVFEVSALSNSDLSYQWFFNDEAIPGQTAANIVIDPVREVDLGNYHVEVRNSENLVTSNTAVLSEKQIAPKLQWSSGNQAVASGTAVTFSANFSGSTPLTFAWTKNGQAHPRETPSLTFPSAQVADAGAYRLTATNSAGSATVDFTISVVQSPWERWEWRRAGVPNASITDIKVYDGEAYAVSATTLLRSTDGVNWTKSVFPQGFTGNSIAKAGNLFVCIGVNMDNQFRVATSTDNAVTWTLLTATGYNVTNLPGQSTVIAYGNAFIARSPSGFDFHRSTDGVAWTRLMTTNLSGQNTDLTGKGLIATDGNKLILASTQSSSNFRYRYHKSTDGINWAEYETQAGGTQGGSRFPRTAFFDGTKFHLFCTYSIYTSEDGENWNYYYAPSNYFSENSYFATSGNTLLAFQGNSAALSYYDHPNDRKYRNLLPSNSHVFTAAANFGDKVLYGTDKGLLSLATGPLDVSIPRERATTLASVEFTENLFIARTQNGSNTTVEDQVSGDGVTWKVSALLEGANATITGSSFGRYFGTRYLQNAIYSGHNPFDVRLNPDDEIGLPHNLTYVGQLANGNALAVSVPNTGSATLRSRAAGATTWTTATIPLTVDSALSFSALGNRWFSRTGVNSSVIHTSTNGTSWASIGITATSPHFVTMGGKSWCVYQSASFPMVIRAAYSTNGTSWPSVSTTGFPANVFNSAFIKRLAAFGDYLVLVGADENLYFSQDGATWLRGFVPGKVVDIAAGNGQLVAAMKNGGIIQTGTPHAGRNAPLVKIISPQTGSSHLMGSRIMIEGTLSDQEDGIATYDAYLGSQLIASGTGNSFRFPVITTDLNGHTVTVRVRDSHGLRQIDSVRLRVVSPAPENLLNTREGNTFIPHNYATVFDGVFYAASTRNVYRSIDGRTWERVEIPSFTNIIYSMASGNGSLVIQFDNGGIITTRDGVNWTHFLPNLTNYWVRERLRFSSGVFIAAYQTQGSNTGSVMTSVDGLSWETGAVSIWGYLSWSANKGDNTIIGVVSPNGVNRSTDNGFNWVSIPQLAVASRYNSHGIFADGKFVVAYMNSSKLFVSPDSFNWTEQSLPSVISGVPILAHIGGLFFLGRDTEFSLVSEDALTWQPISRTIHRQRISYANGLYVAQAISGGIVTSRNGITWTPAVIPGMPAQIERILSNENQHLVIDSTGAVWSSVDGAVWEKLLAGRPAGGQSTSGMIGRSVADLDGKLVIAGSGIAVVSHDNGRTWSDISLGGQAPSTSNTYHKVVSSGAEMIIFQGSSPSFATVIRRSTNATLFETVSGLPSKNWMDIAWNGSAWMLLASDGTLMRSTNGGLTWIQVAAPGLIRGAALAWFNNRWVIIGAENTNTSLPYAVYTLETGDVFQSRGNLGTGYSTSQVRTIIAHGNLIAWMQGNAPFVSTNGTQWTTVAGTNLGGGNNDFHIYHTPEGFAAFGGWSYTASPPKIWVSGTNANDWREVNAPFTNATRVANLGNRVFLFSSGSITELYDKDLALTLPGFSDVSLGVGDQISANVLIQNLGRTIPSGGQWRVTAWLAKNRFFGDTKNILLGTAAITTSMPAPGASQNYPVSFTLPNGIITGSNYLILKLSGPDDIRETNTANNTVISDTAAITIPEWIFNVVTNGNGQVNRDFAAMRYPHKAQVSLTASAGKGAIFTGWAGDAYSPNNQITILMDGNKSVSANFSNRATLQVFLRGAGTISNLSDGGSYPVGQTAAITAAPAPGWVFSRWSGDSTTTQTTASILMDNSKTVTAHFVLPMATWKSSYFNATQLADPNVSGDDKDPDFDGVENWKEYLHGSHPLDKNSTGVSPIAIEEGFLRCLYTRNLGAADGGTVTCQAARNLSAWNAPLQERILSTIDGIQTIEARLPVANQPRGFIRFYYTAPQP